ncbi:MAG: PrpF family protein [Deltaproteobacteria bacterium]|nr:PrpF family protein [Deltaproteobacteria bacterium]
MDRIRYRAVFMRGGTSKGVFFHARDLPAEPSARDTVLLRVLGSPDPFGRQLDGMGGGISSLSKAVIVSPPTHPEADVDYLFAQVAVDRKVVDYTGNCGNLTSAVGPFAVEEGLVEAPRQGETLVRLHNLNTRKVIHSRFQVAEGLPVEGGAFVLAGVSGSAAPIRLDFIDPGGARTGVLLPTGQTVDTLEVPGYGSVEASLVDATNPVVFAAASAFGLKGTESPEQMEASPGLMSALDALRRIAGMRMGLAERAELVGLANPKVALVAAPAPFTALDGVSHGAETHLICVRMVSMERVHRAVTLTGAMCLAAACRIEGTLPHRLARPGPDGMILGHASGLLPVEAEVSRKNGAWSVTSTGVFRTARRLMEGSVVLPSSQ